MTTDMAIRLVDRPGTLADASEFLVYGVTACLRATNSFGNSTFKIVQTENVSGDEPPLHRRELAFHAQPAAPGLAPGAPTSPSRRG